MPDYDLKKHIEKWDAELDRFSKRFLAPAVIG